LNGTSTYVKITDYTKNQNGDLNAVGRDYFCYTFAKHNGKIGATTAATKTAGQLASIGFDEDLGPVSIGADMAGNMRVGYNGRNFGVRTAVKAGRNGLSHITTGTVDLPRFRGQFSVINSPHQQFYSAAGKTTLGKILVGGSASYSPNNGSVNTGVTLGNSPKTSKTPQVEIAYKTHSDKTNKSQTVTLRGNFNFNRDGNLMFTGTYNTA